MKKVLITGSTQGIGYAIAKAFVEDGWEVTVHCSKDLEKAQRIQAQLGAHHAVVCDLGDMAQVTALYKKTGAVDCLILNASVQFKENWLDISDETFDQQVTVNLKSTLKLMQAYYPAMKEKGFGRIVTIGSVNQQRQHPELSLYGATKAAVMRLVKNVAKEAAPYGVTVNNISPGAIATPRNEAIFKDKAKQKAVEEQIPMGRFGTPEDCIGAIRLLCSDAGSYITGIDLVIDGGMTL